MSFRFFQRVRLLPGLTLNFSKRGVSLSAGPRGAKLTAGTRGTRATLGLPGSGLFYTVHRPWGGSRARASSRTAGPTISPSDVLPKGQTPLDTATPAQRNAQAQLELNRLQRWWLPAEQVALRDALLALHAGQRETALTHLQQALPALAEHGELHWLAGVLCFELNDDVHAWEHLQEALSCFSQAAPPARSALAEVGVTLTVAVPLAPWLQAQLRPGRSSTWLLLAELAQRNEEPQVLRECLHELHESERQDPVLRAAYLEALVDTAARLPAHEAQDWLQEAVRLSEAVVNEHPADAVSLHYGARALQALGLDEAARQIWTAALRKTSQRPPELLRQMRYERALSLERAGQMSRAQREWQALYAQDPGFEDVARRLGLRSEDRAGE